jgi:uncharacterized membrane protein
MKRLLSVVLFLSLASLAWAPAPQAAQGLVVSTAYPSQEVEAGESLTLDLEIRNVDLPPQVVALEATGLPEGWTARFTGGGRVVRAVHVDGTNPRQVKLNVDVPAGVEPQAYSVEVVARGQDTTARLPLELTVGAGLPPQLGLETELPILMGTTSSTFTYRLKVTNDAEEDVMAGLTYEAPDGFRVTFKTAGQEVTSVPVAAGETKSIDVAVKAGEALKAGEYPVRVHVQAGELNGTADLTAVLTGEPALAISGPDGRLSGRANAGRETPLELIIQNTGTAAAENVRLEASPPATWDVTFEPETIPVLEPNEQMQVIARINPPQQAVAGDYMLNLRVVPGTGTAETADYRITLTTSTIWGVVGLVLIAAALGVVMLAVARFGRR